MTTYALSANTGYLWLEHPFLERIRLAKAHGFDAVEFHDEVQRHTPEDVKQVLQETSLPVMSLNVRMRETFGCAAIPGLESQARRDIDEALGLAQLLGASAIHFLSGITTSPDWRQVLESNLAYALEKAEATTILIEPICPEGIAGYALANVDDALAIVASFDDPHLRMMFDTFHVGQLRGAERLVETFVEAQPLIGHVQIAAVPDRGEPGEGVVDIPAVMKAMKAAGYDGAFGCEYRPRSTTEAGLSWRTLLYDR